MNPYLTDADICNAIQHIAKDEPTVHPSVRPAVDVATRKALWWAAMFNGNQTQLKAYLRKVGIKVWEEE